MAGEFVKLAKFEGQDFRRWQKKMLFLLTTMKVVYVLTTPAPEEVEDETIDQTRKRNKFWNNDFICRGTILNGIFELGNIAIKSSDIFELVGFLPRLQELCLNFENCKLAGGSKLVPTVFPCLKTLTLDTIDFGSSAILSCAFGMIWGSPNLQTLIVIATYSDVVPPPSLKCLEVHYTKMRMLQLQFVGFSSFRGSETEVCLIKCILACSPSLERITIMPGPFLAFGGEKEKLMFASKLLELPRASTIAEVKIRWPRSET